MEKAQRIARRIAVSGLCSRREAERWILQGRVTVDGQKVETPAFTVTAQQEIRVDGDALPQVSARRLWCLHKPKGYITSHKDEQGRQTIYALLPDAMARLHYIGRLDYQSEGLLLLTNDAELKRRWEQPETALPRRYQVRVRGKPSAATLQQLAKGVTVEGVHYKPVQASLLPGSGGQNHWLQVVLTEGKNREIRRLFEHFGHPVSRLIRTAYGPVTLDALPAGKWREIEVPEI